jgi:hypothetical protein
VHPKGGEPYHLHVLYSLAEPSAPPSIIQVNPSSQQCLAASKQEAEAKMAVKAVKVAATALFQRIIVVNGKLNFGFTRFQANYAGYPNVRGWPTTRAGQEPGTLP